MFSEYKKRRKHYIRPNRRYELKKKVFDKDFEAISINNISLFQA